MSRAVGLAEAAGTVAGHLQRVQGDPWEDGLVRSALVALRYRLLREAEMAAHPEGELDDPGVRARDLEDLVDDLDTRLVEVERLLEGRGWL